MMWRHLYSLGFFKYTIMSHVNRGFKDSSGHQYLPNPEDTSMYGLENLQEATEQ